MLKKRTISSSLILAILLLCFQSCKQENTNTKNQVIIRVAADANSLNPLKARGEVSNYICMQVFQTLVGYDYENGMPVGIIAEEMPTEKKIDSNTSIFTYTLRNNVRFDSTHALSAEDVLFSFKLAICPGIVSSGGANYYEFIDSLIIDPINQNQIHIYCHGNYFLNKYFTGDFFILPQFIYDPQNILNQYSIAELRKPDILDNNPELNAYIEFFNQSKFEKDKNFIKGSGPYEIADWQSNQRIILQKKKNWWAAELDSESCLFDQNPPILQYEIISDNTTALTALKSNKIDLIKGINAKAFQELENQTELKTERVVKCAYDYLAFNCNHDLLKDHSIRKALAFLVNKQELIDKLYFGNAKNALSPISSQQKDLINSNLIEYTFSMDSTVSILKANQWTDSDKNGVLDKTIKGELVELSFDYLFNNNDVVRKSFGIILQSRAKSIGIELNLIGVEWSSYLEKLKSGDFDLCYGSVSSAPIPPDLYSSFHSKSANGGRNYSNYQSEEADRLIEAIRNTNSTRQRIKHYHDLQTIINRDLPKVILVEPMETFAYSPQLLPLTTSPIRPNYWAPSIQIK
ncbi:MAG: hypothetical protein DWP98_00225 [Bacteroidetes bacterium]|nr:MAG: hypothetical protein DWP98_00225 [Bacteroidota bacterium]MBL1144978.1 hypothetical protein [Bacteroidota bacterium]NOG57773.1 hypothetical protein [Bacteroidota bacterium]